jgi:hypothetical protein
MVTMWLTHRNLLGLSLLGACRAGRGGQPLPIPITVRSERPLQALQFSSEGRLWLAQVDAVPQPLLLPVLGPGADASRLEAAGGEPLPGRASLLDAAGYAAEGWLAPAPEYGPLRGEATADTAGSWGSPPRPRWGFDMLRPTRAVRR